MKIVIATPLYPPEVGDPASYVKELAKRLAERHEVSVVMYGYLPEKIFGVSFVCIDKRRPLPIRLFRFTLALRKAVKHADILYSENGASVELPSGIIHLLTKKPLILHFGDAIAMKKAGQNFFFRYIERFARKCAKKEVRTIPSARPEILPFTEKPEAEFDAYERSWSEHIRTIEHIFTHGT